MARSATSKNIRKAKKSSKSGGSGKGSPRGAMSSARSTNPRKKK